MPKYQSSGKYRSNRRYNRSLKDVYRTLQNLYNRIDQLQRYKSSGGSSSGSYGHKARIMSRYQSEHHPAKYMKEKVEPRYVVRTETPKYRIETPRVQTNAEQLADETEKKIEAKFKPLIEAIGRKLDERESPESAPSEIESQDVQAENSKSHDDLRKHPLELREFEDPDWNGSRDDLEFLWNMREALVHTVENPAQDIESGVEDQKIEAEPVILEPIHGTESSGEFKLSSRAELPSDETDFFALESELFGAEAEMEPEVEGQAEVGFG